MTDHRELLELAARAMGIDITIADGDSVIVARRRKINLGCSPWWDPIGNSGDSHDMCAALGIDTEWLSNIVCCERGDFDAAESFKDHNGDKSAAWRLAALRVAAEIGKGML